MPQQTIEERVAALESRFTELLNTMQSRPPKGAWRSVVGMFADDPRIEDLQREVQRIRDDDRASIRQGES
ncbi:MAG: hypothetical protein U0805_11885 [Pirellulales bacterium]